MELERIEFIIASVAPEPDYKASNSRKKTTVCNEQ